MKLAGKTAWITGGNSGIGLAAARLFVAEGANLAITGRNQATLDAAVRELGPNALAIRNEVTDVAGLEAAATQIAARFGRIDVVFANAGIPGRTAIGQTTLEAFESVIRTNLTAVFFTVQAALPYLTEGASVILNGSVHAVLGIPGSSAYAASKAGVRAMARNLAAELSPRGIRVNLVVPGATRTPIWAGREAVADGFARTIPLGRLGEAEEVARAALFLASSDSSYLQAAEIVVDGGATGAPSGAPNLRPA